MGFQEKICGVASEISFHVEIFILLKVSCDVRRLKVSFSMQGGVLFNGFGGSCGSTGFVCRRAIYHPTGGYCW